jgi:purine-binding chemotaxis protein CheW
MPDRTQEVAMQVLCFEVGGMEYGIPEQSIREIFPYAPPVAVAWTPPSIRGIMEVRGSAIPVIDVALKLGCGPTETTTARSRVLVVGTELAGARVAVGLLVGAVREVLAVRPEQVGSPPAGLCLDFLTGIARPDLAPVLLLDVDRVVSASESDLTAQHRALRAAQAGKRDRLAASIVAKA